MSRRLLQQSFSWLVSPVLRKAEGLHLLVEWTIHLKRNFSSITCHFSYNPQQTISLSLLWNTCLAYPFSFWLLPHLCQQYQLSSHVRGSLQKFPSIKTISGPNKDKNPVLVKIQVADKLGLLHFRPSGIESSLSPCSPSSLCAFLITNMTLRFELLYEVGR